MSVNRKELLLKHISIEGHGLEIGPLCWPLLKKTEANIKYVDHVSRNELIEIYKDDPGVPAKLIPKVDFPLNGRSLRDSIPKQKQFDYIIASHVIEHVPDMIRWFEDMASVLKVDGVLTLAIPDKRYTFDIDRQVSTPGDVIGAYFDKLTKPSAGMVFDYASNFREKIDAKKSWEGELYLNSKSPHRHSAIGAYGLCVESQTQYVDTHCYVFTPVSFFGILETLIKIGHFNFEVLDFYDTEEGAYEFLVTLQKTRSDKGMKRQLESVPELQTSFIRELDSRILEQSKAIYETAQNLRAVRQELDHVLASKSWKLTRPVRGAVRHLKKLKHS